MGELCTPGRPESFKDVNLLTDFGTDCHVQLKYGGLIGAHAESMPRLSSVEHPTMAATDFHCAAAIISLFRNISKQLVTHHISTTNCRIADVNESLLSGAERPVKSGFTCSPSLRIIERLIVPENWCDVTLSRFRDCHG